MPKRGRYSRGPVGLSRMTDRRVMRFVAPEKKFLDVFKDPGVWTVPLKHLTSAGMISTLENTNLAASTGGFGQGSGASQRIGSKISIDSISLRLNVRQPGFVHLLADFLAPPQFRLMVVLDKQPNGVVAAIAGATPDASILVSGGDAADYGSYQRNLSATSRYTILYDKIHTLHRDVSLDASAGLQQLYEAGAKQIIINKKFKKPVLREFATGTADPVNVPASTVIKNQFLMLLLPVGTAPAMDPAGPPTQQLILSGSCRFRFTDS